MSEKVLKTVVFMGSARNITPPWGGDTRLGDRALKWVVDTLKARRSEIGPDVVRHDVTVYDPLEVFGPDGALQTSGAELQTPHFFLKKEMVPAAMAQMADTIRAADCYVIVTAEYNHSVPPALLSMMGHFGGSNYSGKCSAIVTYSPGPWGGMRAAMALRPVLSELGCLPVSKLTGLGGVGDILDADGKPKDPEHRMLKQLPSMLAQLEWLGLAMQAQREKGPCP